ncbi:hypothetical protein C8F01DRAFT_1206632 [Mycena amicta]|nr:hypothetical protein C8F01DRAFT_1206632 [Mycena amicta]
MTCVLQVQINHIDHYLAPPGPLDNADRVPFYGFHSSYTPFLKIYLLNPALVNRAVTILRSGLSTHFRVCESHLSFPLQFMTDYGLDGCDWLKLSEAFKRGEYEDEPNPLKTSSHYCQTKMPLEVDTKSFHILNRHQLVARNMHHKLEIPAPPFPPEPLVLGVRELWDDERERRRAFDSARSPRGDWVSEVMWWEEIRKRIETEKTLVQSPEPQHDWQKWAPTTFESVEALWEESHRAIQVTDLDTNDEYEYEESDAEISMSADQLNQLVEDEVALEKDWDRGDSPDVDADIEPENDDDETESEIEEALSSFRRTDNTYSVTRASSSTQQLILIYASSRQPDNPVTLTCVSSCVAHRSSHSMAAAPDSDNEPPTKKRRTHLNLAARSVAYLISHNAMTVKTKPKPLGANCYEYFLAPPTPQTLLAALDTSSIPSKVYRPPFYSDNDDVQRPRLYGGLRYIVSGNPNSLMYLDDWVDDHTQTSLQSSVLPLSSGWEKWLITEGHSRRGTQHRHQSQIEGPTPKNIYGLKTIPVPGAASVRGAPRMSVLSLEVFAFRDADADKIFSKIIFLDKGASPTSSNLSTRSLTPVLELDPDILVGWEVQSASWGYLDERARQFGYLEIVPLLSRAISRPERSNDQWSSRQNSSFKVTGRHVLNLWRVMRSEVTLNIYTFENVAFHCLGRRVPHFSLHTLKKWYQDESPEHKSRIYSYFFQRTEMNLDILEATEVVTKTAGFQVLSRGSQFKVESFMFRIAKPESFVLVSPSREDVGRQNAAEAMPLILEPQSAFYTSPVLVLDFQSLYPSIMIAENYCYSTFVGRVKQFQGRQKFGVISDLDLPPGRVESLYEHITVSPTGMMFVKPEVRKGLLGRMLTELLDTRVMVKQAMKGAANDKALKRVLDARQLALKFIANVTYGYTSATFSGRMPAVEIADSIVQSGRETLEKAISVINSEPRWGAEVVYGDTDSAFVHLPGKTKDQAFRIGYEISETITSMNPSPVKLKFEKVYLPCVLLAKKRYVGYRFDHPDDVEPIFDAKGIETVRRDSTLAQKKMTEAVLHMLFRTQDLTKIKDYCLRSWQRILAGKVTIEDFIFAREVRMGGYSDKGPPPPGVVVAARQAFAENAEAQYKERVRYVICQGPAQARLVDKAYAPSEVVNSRTLRLDAVYYISRVLVPPLDRILSLAGADIRKWFEEMPKGHVYTEAAMSPTKTKAGNDNTANLIDENFYRSQCLACEMTSDKEICDDCYRKPEVAMSQVLSKLRRGEKRLLDTNRICSSCSKTPLGEPMECDSLDCSWLYARKKAEAGLDFLEGIQNVILSN